MCFDSNKEISDHLDNNNNNKIQQLKQWKTKLYKRLGNGQGNLFCTCNAGSIMTPTWGQTGKYETGFVWLNLNFPQALFFVNMAWSMIQSK